MVFSHVEIIIIQKAGWQCSAPTFQGTEEKNPRDLGQNIVAFFNEKNGKDISSNMQLDKLYRHHSDRNSEHPIVPAQELVTESQS